MSRFLCLWLIKPDILVIHPVDGLLWLQEIDVAGPIACVCICGVPPIIHRQLLSDMIHWPGCRYILLTIFHLGRMITYLIA